MTDNEVTGLVLGIWIIIALVIEGIWREVRGQSAWNEDEPFIVMGEIFWPLVLPVLAVVGVAWFVIWSTRRLVRALMWWRRSKLPRAEVRRS
jgi:chromate transport protein ChrA